MSAITRTKENGVDEVTDHKDEVEFLANTSVCLRDLRVVVAAHPADGCDRDRCHLADHRVESERGHCSPRYTLQPHCCSKELCWDSPTQGTACDEEDYDKCQQQYCIRVSTKCLLPKLKSHVKTTKAQCALVLLESVGYILIIAALMIKVTQRKRHPKICSGRRPSESMVIMQIEVPTKAMIALTAWKSKERLVEMPICAKI